MPSTLKSFILGYGSFENSLFTLVALQLSNRYTHLALAVTHERDKATTYRALIASMSWRSRPWWRWFMGTSMHDRASISRSETWCGGR